MADYLASIYGTEKDKVNCSFYFKIGACRHGERCSRKHIKPSFSQTLLLSNLYRNPSHDPTANMSPEQLQEDFDLFFEDIFMELAKFGEIEEMVVCDNVGDHLVGNVYVQYHYEEQAGNAVEDLNKRFYAGRPLYAELSPVTDFREACCRQHEISECNRGGFCNFMHLKHPRRALRRELFEAQRLSVKEKKREERHAEDKRREKSASPRHHKDERRTEREDDGYQHAPSELDNGDTKRSRTEDSHEYRS